jgi:hypothetical protein
MVFEGDCGTRRVVVAADDSTTVRSGHVEWADVVAKVNISLRTPDRVNRSTLMPLGPTFGMRLPAARGARISLGRSLLLFGTMREHLSVRDELGSYVHLEPEKAYTPGTSESNYVYFIATSWVKFPEPAPLRAAFMNACRHHKDITFEGGFAPRPDGDQSDYPELYLRRRYKQSEYIANTKRSLCVFNNPAVDGCLGWKLGEFLALGKAIISIPLDRKMPGNFEPDEHFLAVDGSDEQITAALDRVRGDVQLRRRLEQRARSYYLDYLQPRALIRRILAAAYG